MNPGNGIETVDGKSEVYWLLPFKLMNPGNGIETRKDTTFLLPQQRFQINESRQRDWNLTPAAAAASLT